MLYRHSASTAQIPDRKSDTFKTKHTVTKQHNEYFLNKFSASSQSTELNLCTNHQYGLTLLELMVVIAVIGIVAALAAPSYQKMLEANRLKRVAESFKSDMQLARTRAIKQSTNIIVSRTTGTAGSWCYGLSATTTSCDCKQATVATTDDCEIKSVPGSDFGTTDMYSASGNSTFDFRRGTIGNNGVTFNTDHYAARVVFSQVGRVSICTPPAADPPTATDRPLGTVGLAGIPDC